MPDITMQALKRLPDVEVRGVSYGANQYWTFGEGWTIIPLTPFRQNPLRRLAQYLGFVLSMTRGVLWADLIMWTWDIDPVNFWLIRILRKPVFVEWIGSDIRVPDILFELNPHYKKAWENGDWDYKYESRERSRAIQQRFHRLRAIPILCVEMSLFLDRQLFPTTGMTFYQRINVGEFAVRYPDTQTSSPVLVHTPSALGTKGTRYVREAIGNLKKKGLAFDYVEITNKPRAEALEAIGQADLFIDQFIAGSYGLATCEAMAMGKPVFCYLMPAVKQGLPPECPIVSCTTDELTATLERYITDAALRNETGRKSRQFAETYHDANLIALQLRDLFTKTLGRS